MARSPSSLLPPAPAAAGPRAPESSKPSTHSASSPAATAHSSKPTWPRAAAFPARPARLSRISSPPATSPTDPRKNFCAPQNNYGYEGPLFLSPGKSVGLRLIPTERDLRFAWEEMPQQVLDEQQQKLRDSLRQALIGWARQAGEASDYTDNLPASMPPPGWPLVRGAQPLPQRRPRPPPRRAASAQIPPAPQYRYSRR